MYKRKYENDIEQAVYENSIDCLRYGYGFSYLNKCELDESHARKIWKSAIKDMEKF